MQLKLQSSLQRVAILLVFFGFAYSSYWTYSTGNLRLQSTDISTFRLFSFPNNVAGSISFSVNTSYDIQICFQEYVAPASFSSCDPKLYWSFKASTNTTALLSRFDEDLSNDLRDDFFNPKKIQSYIELLSKPKATNSFKNTTSHFLAGRQYWLAAAFTQNQNATFSIDFTSNLAICSPPTPYATPTTCVGSPNTILNSQPDTSIVAKSTSVYFSVVIPPAQNASYYTGSLNLNLKVAPVDPSNSTFSLAFYIQRNSLPDPNVYDASYNVTSNTNASFSIPTPLPGTYYIYTANTFSLSVTVSVQAIYFSGCSIANSTDPRCPVKTVTMPSASTTSLVTGTQYFEFNTSELIFGVGTKDLTNAPPIYLSVNTSGWPSQYSYMAKAEKSDVNFFDFQTQPAYSTYRFFGTVNPNATANSIWRVAVVANSSQSYYFWSGTYCAYNCTGGSGKTKALGTCDQTTGKCTCTSTKASPLFCSRNGLSTGWIIVIIIIVIIVVACAIGIPLALYLRQRRNKNYERV